MNTLQVHGRTMAKNVPLSQLTKAIKIDWEEPAKTRVDRRRATTLRTEPGGTTYLC